MWQRGALVEASLREPGASTFGPAQTITGAPTPPDLIYTTPRGAIDNAGNVAAVWQEHGTFGGTGRYVIRGFIRTAGQSLTAGTRTFLTRTDAGNAGSQYVDVQLRADGTGMALWDYSADGRTVHVQTADVNPAAAGPWGAAADVPAAASNAAYGSFGLDAAGNAVLAWVGRLPDIIQSSTRQGIGGLANATNVSAASTDSLTQALAVGAGGDATVLWTAAAAGVPVYAAHRAPGGGFADVTPVATPAGFESNPAVSTDDQGNSTAAWTTNDGAGSYAVQTATYDAAPPTISALAVPASATAGQAGAFSATASDRISTPSLSWSFGDGATATGASPSHAYGAAGSYTVTVTATDASGRTASRSTPLTVTAAAGPRPIPSPPGPPAPPAGRTPRARRATGSASFGFRKLHDGRTQLTSLVIRGLVPGQTVRLTCSGRGCRKAVRSLKRTIKANNKGRLSLTTAVSGMKLSPRAHLSLIITRRGYATHTTTYTFVRGASPSRRSTCLAAGARKATAC